MVTIANVVKIAKRVTVIYFKAWWPEKNFQIWTKTQDMQAPPCFHIFDFAVVSLSLGYLSLFPLYTLPSSIELKAMSDFVLCWMLLVTWRLYSRTHPPNGQQNPPQPILASYIWLIHNWDTLPLDNHQPCNCWVVWYSHEYLCMWWRHTQAIPWTPPDISLPKTCRRNLELHR